MSLSQAELVKRLQRMDNEKFEHFIAELWERRGWKTKTTDPRDEGIDVIAIREDPFPEKELIQAKRYHESNRIGGPELQQYGSLHHRENVDKVIVVTTSDFTDSALSEAKKSNVKPINGTTLAKMVDKSGAEDLVKKYTDEVTVDEVESQTPSKDIETKPTKKGSEPLTLVSNGEDLTAELVGMDRVSTQTSGYSVFRKSSNHFEGIIAAFNLFNRVDEPLIIEEIDQFQLIDQNGIAYSAGNLGKGSFGDWKKHGGKGELVDDGWVYSGETCKYAVGFGIPSTSKPAKITLARHGIQFEFDHEVRQEIASLPNSLTKYL